MSMSPGSMENWAHLGARIERRASQAQRLRRREADSVIFYPQRRYHRNNRQQRDRYARGNWRTPQYNFVEHRNFGPRRPNARTRNYRGAANRGRMTGRGMERLTENTQRFQPQDRPGQRSPQRWYQRRQLVTLHPTRDAARAARSDIRRQNVATTRSVTLSEGDLPARAERSNSDASYEIRETRSVDAGNRYSVRVPRTSSPPVALSAAVIARRRRRANDRMFGDRDFGRSLCALFGEPYTAVNDELTPLLQEIFTCLVCLEPMGGGVRMCDTCGQLCCIRCSVLLDVCPFCRVRFMPLRSPPLDSILDVMEVTCVFASEGCNEIMSGRAYNAHITQCAYAPWRNVHAM